MNWWTFIEGLLGGGVIASSLFIFFLMNPEKLKVWGSIFLWFFSKFWRGAKYLAIKAEVEGKVNSFVRNLESKTTFRFPYISIRWAASDSGEVVYEDDKAIIVMRDREHRNKNLVHAAYFFTSESLLKKSKRHLSPSQKTSIDLYATKKVLESQTAAAEQQFMNDYFIPIAEKHQEIADLIKELIPIDDIGVFFPVLINELVALGNKFFLDKPTQEIISEVKALVDFLEKFSWRESRDGTPDEFFGKYTRCAIKIVASQERRRKGDTSGHENIISRVAQRGFENIYLLGRPDDHNKEYIEAVIAGVLEKNKDIEVVQEYSFAGRIMVHGKPIKVKSYLVHLHNPSAVKFIRPPKEVAEFSVAAIK